MELFTFLFEFDGGSYVSQVRAPSWEAAPDVWAASIGEPEWWDADDAAELAQRLRDDLVRPVALQETQGVWSLYPEVRGQTWIVTFVRTAPASAI